MRVFLSITLFIFITFAVHAVGVDEKQLAVPASEIRAQEIMKKLRCLVCQNQSIVDSDAPLAKDLREIVRERITAGDTDKEVLFFMTKRYGDWVLLKPPFDRTTIILWLSPVLLLLIGFFVIYRNQSHRKSLAVSPPLNKEEEKRLRVLLDERADD